jgi:hypothetical protein
MVLLPSKLLFIPLYPNDTVGWSNLCTPGMGVNLWGESPLYMNPVPSFYDGSESTSQRQGHHREVVSEGSRSAKL